jgi:hypothetical protein
VLGPPAAEGGRAARRQRRLARVECLPREPRKKYRLFLFQSATKNELKQPLPARLNRALARSTVVAAAAPAPPTAMGTIVDVATELRPGIVVFGRVKGFPWWPAVVSVDIKSGTWLAGAAAAARVWCQFFNDPTGAWLRGAEIRPFDAFNREECMVINRGNARHKKFLPRLGEALRRADDEAGRMSMEGWDALEERPSALAPWSQERWPAQRRGEDNGAVGAAENRNGVLHLQNGRLDVMPGSDDGMNGDSAGNGPADAGANPSEASRTAKRPRRSNGRRQSAPTELTADVDDGVAGGDCEDGGEEDNGEATTPSDRASDEAGSRPRRKRTKSSRYEGFENPFAVNGRNKGGSRGSSGPPPTPAKDTAAKVNGKVEPKPVHVPLPVLPADSRADPAPRKRVVENGVVLPSGGRGMSGGGSIDRGRRVSARQSLRAASSLGSIASRQTALATAVPSMNRAMSLPPESSGGENQLSCFPSALVPFAVPSKPGTHGRESSRGSGYQYRPAAGAKPIVRKSFAVRPCLGRDHGNGGAVNDPAAVGDATDSESESDAVFGAIAGSLDHMAEKQMTKVFGAEYSRKRKAASDGGGLCAVVDPGGDVLRVLLQRVSDLESDVKSLKARTAVEEQKSLGEDATSAGLKAAVEALAAASLSFAGKREFDCGVVGRALDSMWPDGILPLVGVDGEILRSLARSLVLGACKRRRSAVAQDVQGADMAMQNAANVAGKSGDGNKSLEPERLETEPDAADIVACDTHEKGCDVDIIKGSVTGSATGSDRGNVKGIDNDIDAERVTGGDKDGDTGSDDGGDADIGGETDNEKGNGKGGEGSNN